MTKKVLDVDAITKLIDDGQFPYCLMYYAVQSDGSLHILSLAGCEEYPSSPFMSQKLQEVLVSEEGKDVAYDDIRRTILDMKDDMAKEIVQSLLNDISDTLFYKETDE